MLTTIAEFSEKNNFNITSVRSKIKRSKLKPIDNIQYKIRGYRGKPFKIECLESLMIGFIARGINVSKNKFAKKENYTQKQITDVLRNYPKHQLWNKHIKDWNMSDFTEFNNLKNR